MIARIRCVSVSLSHRRITIISVANSQSCCREGIIVGDRQVGQIQINVLSTCVCQWVHVRHSIDILSELMPLTLLSTHCAVYMLYGQHWRSLYVGDQRPCEHEPSCERCLRDVDVSLTPGWCLSEAPTIGQLRTALFVAIAVLCGVTAVMRSRVWRPCDSLLNIIAVNS